MSIAENSVDAGNFAFVAELLRAECGLVLEPGKEYLVHARLTPLAQKHQVANVDRLIEHLRDQRPRNLVAEVIEAMVTTETSFFRDLHPFETLKKEVLPKLIERRRAQRELNIWCAGIASGQEPYSIALLLREYFPELNSWRINLTATDISQQMLERSRAARYTQLEVNRGLPTKLLLKWFRQEGAFWYLDHQVSDTVTFERLNLVQPWPAMPTWDLIFLRNVMIYFETAVKQQILDRISRVLSKDGYLLLGGAETTLSLSESYERVEALKSGFYRLRA